MRGEILPVLMQNEQVAGEPVRTPIATNVVILSEVKNPSRLRASG